MNKRRISASSIASIGLHILWASFFAFAILVNSREVHYDPWRGVSPSDGPVEMTARYAGTLIDPISAAAQLGRLDYISITLTVVGLVLAAAALVGFSLVRRDAIGAAEEEARKEVERVCPTQVAMVAPGAIAGFFKETDGIAALKALFDQNPGLVYAAVTQITTVVAGDVQTSQADDIASAIGDENGDAA